MTEFRKDKTRRDGFEYICKECKRKSQYDSYSDNPEKRRESKRNSYYNNSSEINKRETLRRSKDCNFQIYHKYITLLRNLIKGRENQDILNLIGCSREYLLSWISYQFKDGMSLENYNKNGWSIDHVIPRSAFILTDPVELQACFHWSNFQPLWKKDNEIKSNKRDSKSENQHLVKSILFEEINNLYI